MRGDGEGGDAHEDAEADGDGDGEDGVRDGPKGDRLRPPAAATASFSERNGIVWQPRE